MAEATRSIYCFGFGPWKFGFVRAYLSPLASRVRFCAFPLDARLRGFDERAQLVVWGLRNIPGLEAFAARRGASIWRMEDGFLRSVGLGSDFVVPASLVLDRQGIYFDPTRPSDLETILQTSEFSPDELRRAASLRESIVSAALSKYNFAQTRAPLARPATDKRVLLVPGQVEDDASIRLGCRDIRTNEGLLAQVRADHPDAYIVFKPHPDLLSENRKAGVLSVERMRELADQVVTDHPLPECLAIADEVHTMTSLVGFEALLRGLPVATYGCPFYAGWGLTRDRHPVARRTRALSLDMLVVGTLIRYPLYLSRETGALTTPEVVIEELRGELHQRGGARPPSRLGRKLRKLKHAVRGLLSGV